MTQKMLDVATDLRLPLDIVTQTIGVLAKRGAGKSYTAAVVAEEMLGAGLVVVICDPVGVFWGLRADAGGTGPGVPILVMGGDHGDVPLEPTSGELVADLVVGERIAAVLDLSLMRKGEQTRFMQDFAERLYQKNRAPLHVILDEADSFAPQRPMPGEQRLLGAIEDLVRRGRARGIGLSLITQRAAVLNKNVLTQVQVLVTLRTIAPQDRDAIDAWVNVHGTPEQRRHLMESLPALPIGTAWWWSPGWPSGDGIFQRVKIRQRRTFDSSATPTVGHKTVAPKALAEVDLAGIRERIAATVERAKANDPRELRRRLAEIEAQLRKAKVEAPQPVVERIEVPAVSDSQVRAIEAAVGMLQQAAEKQVVAAHALLAKGAEILEALASVRNAKPTQAAPIRLPAGTSRPQPIASRRSPTARSDTGGNIGGGLRRMLEALAWRPEGLSARQMGVRSGLSSRGGTFSTYLSRARSAGWVSGSNGRLIITEEGRLALGSFTPAPTGAELRAYWLSELGNSGAARILSTLCEVYPRALSAVDVAERTALSGHGGTFSTYLSRLRALQLVEGRAADLRASDELF